MRTLTIRNWFEHASRPVVWDEDQRIGIFDLDNTLLVNSIQYPDLSLAPKRFSSPHEVCVAGRNNATFKKLTVLVDPIAMNKIRKFAENGHLVMVASTAFYSFESIAKIFARYGVQLKKKYFFNRQAMHDMLKVETTYKLLQMRPKSALLKKVLKNYSPEKILLFDDLETNAALDMEYLFELIDPAKEFPKIVELPPAKVPDSLKLVLKKTYCNDGTARQCWHDFIKQSNREILSLVAAHFKLLSPKEWVSIISTRHCFFHQCIKALLTAVIDTTFIHSNKPSDRLALLQDRLSAMTLDPALHIDAMIEQVETIIEGKARTTYCFFFEFSKDKLQIKNEQRLSLAKILYKQLAEQFVVKKTV